MMKQGIQADFPEPRLKASGCHFFALLRFLEWKHGMSFDDNNMINSIFSQALEKGFMGKVIDNRGNVLDDCETNILFAPELLNMILGKKVYEKYIRDLKIRPDKEVCIVRLVRPGGTHFLCESMTGELFDPMPPSRPAAATWSFDSYRYLA